MPLSPQFGSSINANDLSSMSINVGGGLQMDDMWAPPEMNLPLK